MKKFLGILLALVSLLLTAAGIAGIVLIGSDNTVNSPSTTITLDDAKVVVSTAGVLAFTNTTLRLQARNSGGSVFIGQAHPIDATSYAEAVPKYAVTTVDASGMSGEIVKGDAKAVLPDPTKQSFWTAKATGAGTQTLNLKLDGTPTQYVVMPLGKTGDLSMTSGVVVKNGFVLSIAALVLGLLGLLGVVLLGRRRKQPIAHSAHTTSPEPSAVETQTETPAPSRTMTRIVSFAVMGVTLPALAGCGVVPTKVDAWKTSEITKPAMVNQAEAVATLADHDQRRNAVDKAAAKTFNPRLWDTVYDGPSLANAVLATQYAKIAKDRTAVTRKTTVKQVYAPSFNGYPMFALVGGTESFGKNKPEETLYVLTRRSVTAPWLMTAGAAVPQKALPRPATPGNASSLGEGDRGSATAAVSALTSQLNTGKGGPALPKDLGDFLTELRKPKEGSSTIKSELWAESAPPLSPEGSAQAVKTTSGQLMLVSYDLLTTQTAKLDYVWRDDPENQYRTVTSQTGDQHQLIYRRALMVAMSVDTKGKSTVLGYGMYLVR